MGIDIRAKFIYGVVADDIDGGDWDLIVDAASEGDLDYASPYYDSPSDEWIISFETEPNLIDSNSRENALSYFEEVIGKEVTSRIKEHLQFYCTPHVY